MSMHEINVTPLVDILLVLLIIFMVTTALAEQKKRQREQQESVTEKTQSLVDLNLPVTPENPLLADPETTKLVIVADKKLRIFIVRGLSFEAGTTPIADCSNAVNAKDPKAWQPCINIVAQSLKNNVRLLKEGLYLQADADVPSGFVGAILRALRQNGLEKVDIVTDPAYKRKLEAQRAAAP